MDSAALADALRGRDEPTIVCAQAGEVNSGAFDPLDRIVPIVRDHPNAWLHVDGAFGLWAGASPRLRHLVRGIDGADSWGTDAHKWLNVPYDAGVVFVRDAAAHRAAMGMAAAYLPPAPGQERDPFDYVPEMSRRARGFPIYAAIRSLGATGIADMVERCCDTAARMARQLANHPRDPDRQRGRAQPGPGGRRRRTDDDGRRRADPGRRRPLARRDQVPRHAGAPHLRVGLEHHAMRMPTAPSRRSSPRSRPSARGDRPSLAPGGSSLTSSRRARSAGRARHAVPRRSGRRCQGPW